MRYGEWAGSPGTDRSRPRSAATRGDGPSRGIRPSTVEAGLADGDVQPTGQVADGRVVGARHQSGHPVVGAAGRGRRRPPRRPTRAGGRPTAGPGRPVLPNRKSPVAPTLNDTTGAGADLVAVDVHPHLRPRPVPVDQGDVGGEPVRVVADRGVEGRRRRPRPAGPGLRATGGTAGPGPRRRRPGSASSGRDTSASRGRPSRTDMAAPLRIRGDRGPPDASPQARHRSTSSTRRSAPSQPGRSTTPGTGTSGGRGSSRSTGQVRVVGLLLGQPPQPGGPGVPGVDDHGLGQPVVQGVPVLVEQDADEAQAEQQEAERQGERADDRLARR